MIKGQIVLGLVDIKSTNLDYKNVMDWTQIIGMDLSFVQAKFEGE